MLYGDRIVVFGRIEVPSFLAANEPLARQILQVHGWAALLLLALIGLQLELRYAIASSDTTKPLQQAC
jgi:cytochrome b561